MASVVRIHPPPPLLRCKAAKGVLGAGIAQLAEHQPSKLRAAGSIPVSRSDCAGNAHIAQSAEHLLGKEEVIGSNPIVGSDGLFFQEPGL